MQVQRQWHLIDLSSAPLGRLASQIAKLLVGKHQAGYSPNLDTGDYVVAINSDALVMTGRKMSDKLYYRHSGFPGGFKSRSAQDLLKQDSRKLVEQAVKGMLPKNKLHSPRLRRLKIYHHKEHPHASQIQA